MLNVPKLDDLSYEQIFTRMRSKIPTLTDEWTDFNYHDPGITTLNVFAWLSDLLNYYIDATGEAHRLKYLKLLGIHPQESAADSLISIEPMEESSYILLPRGTRFVADDIIFEAVETHQEKYNILTNLYGELNGSFRDLKYLIETQEDYAPIFFSGNQENLVIYLGFKNQLNQIFRFYVQVDETHRRNIFDMDFSLSVLSWEYCSDKGWQSAEIQSDETRGFLRSGFICISLDGNTTEFSDGMMDKAHYLRCRVIKNQYDQLPRLGKISVNNIKVIQTCTYAQTLEFTGGNAKVNLDWYVRQSDILTVMLKAKNCEEYEVLYLDRDTDWGCCDVRNGDFSWQRTIQFHGEWIEAALKQDTGLAVLVVDSEHMDAFEIGETDGCANQRLDFYAENIYELRLGLFHKSNGKWHCNIWDSCGDLGEAGYESRVFFYDRERQQIVFGDGIHGVQPERGQKVRAITVKTSLLDEGNVMAGSIQTMADTQGLAQMRINNEKNAFGGRRMETSSELEEQIEIKMNAVSRAVTAEDYKEIVKSTPGLLIDCVNVLTMKEYSQSYGVPFTPNTVVVAVKPQSNDQCPILSENYRRIIREHLEQYRLLTTNIQVVPARYVKVSAYGRVRLRDGSVHNETQIESYLSKILNGRCEGAFGRGIIYGKIFSALEIMDGVSSLEQLVLECAGEGGSKNDHGDIIICNDSLSYPGDIKLEFV